MATKLQIYNEALRLVGDLRLTSTATNGNPNDDVEARYALDDAWERAVWFCGAQADWPFATTDINPVLNSDSYFGYNKSYTFDPNVWLRTVAVSLDVHYAAPAHYQITGNKFRFNTSQNRGYFRYISKQLLGNNDIPNWPEMFCSVVAHRLAFEICERLTQDSQKAQAIYQLFGQVLGAAKSQIALETSTMVVAPAQWAEKVHNVTIGEIWDEALRLMGTGDPKKAMLDRPADAKPVYQIMELAWRRVAQYCLTEGYWNFATRTVGFSTSAGSIPGFAFGFEKPSDWLRTVSVAASTDPDFRSPINYRDQLGVWYTNASAIIVRFISNRYAADGQAGEWPDGFKRVLACRLAYECVDLVTAIPEKRQQLEKDYAVVLARALAQDAADGSLAIPQRRTTAVGSIWREALRLMGYDEAAKAGVDKEFEADRAYPVLDAAWERVVRFCLTEHYWNFATTTTSIASSGAASLGFTYGFNKPSNWLRTIHVASDTSFSTNIEYRDEGGRLLANITPIYLRYVSSAAALDSAAASWPEAFTRVVAYRLAYECVEVITRDPNKRKPLLEEYALALNGAKLKDAADQSLVIPKRRNSTISAIWKEAARLIGFPETKKATPETEIGIEGVYQIFDDAWQRVVKFCLTEGLWNFATVTTSLAESGSPIPGWQYRFSKPTGWLRTISISTTAEFYSEARYHDEGGKLYANYNPLYIRYLSSTYGQDSEAPNWPELFCRVLAYRLAYECADVVTGDPNRSTKLFNDYKMVLSSAKNKDAMDQAQMFPKTSNWLGAMRGGSGRRYDRGPIGGF